MSASMIVKTFQSSLIGGDNMSFRQTIITILTFSINVVDDNLVTYPNIANAMRNMDAFEDIFTRTLKEKYEFSVIIHSASEQTSVSASVGDYFFCI